MHNDPATMTKLITTALSEARVVGDIMTRHPITLNEEDNLAILQEEMQNIGLRHIPVVDGKKLVGLVTHRDLLKHTLGGLKRSRLIASIDAHDKHEHFVADIMTRDVQTASVETPIAQAAAWLATGKLRQRCVFARRR